MTDLPLHKRKVIYKFNVNKTNVTSVKGGVHEFEILNTAVIKLNDKI